ncbi:p-glycoprotein (MDR1) [Leptomonas pyrrhocoris]|uniref:p-glycoprotein (MDR1) n=1 Tax=Leptomonas pyrrhocoris TaxID=157538 RepID=A0A0M9FSI3_LEPPY|nr:p-glycoprotein (MDR1) [Leptomonas pyrrhocoris]KPA75143.1 p-glycoprotein (MDR1) [Leptomonas pyrrhocoris]|eukprot:XP_015653582.1 p-glycoprotein (MDR1) [Leptomonas pyrrhocoris]
MTRGETNKADRAANEPTHDPALVLARKAADENNGSEKDDSLPSSTSLDSEKDAAQRVSVLEIFHFADRKDLLLMAVGLVAAMVAGGGMPAFSFALGRLVNDLLSTSPETSAAQSALIMVYIGIAVSIACMVHVACWCVAAVRQVSRIRASYFSAVLRQDMGWHDAHKPGELTARMTGDTRIVQNGINDRFSQGALNLFSGVFGFAFGFVFCWEVTLVMLGMMPFVALAGALLGNVLAKASSESRKQFATAGSIATEVIENVRTVQLFGQEEHEVERFRAAVRLSEKPGMKREFVNSLSVGTTMGLVILTYMVVFFFSQYIIIWGRSTIGDIVATFLSVLFGSIGIGFFFPSLTAFAEARAAAHVLFTTIARVPAIDIDAGGLPVTAFVSDLRFEHVRFSYPTRPDQVLFTDLNLTIRRGQKVAFSGASGCGKSSIIGLIQRFYDPAAGAVLVDEVDMRELDLFQWRDQIGIVSQEPNLFAGTMAENVRVGKPGATFAEVVAACKQANIHDTIMALPDQYDTSVGAVGSQLSGGQKQRIAIARALIKRPAVLLLDEATSALDRKSEVEVQAALNQLMQESNMTIVVIAHRLATIRNVDCIYYVSYDGVHGSCITEQGTYDALMQHNGMFAAMAKSQGGVHEAAGEGKGTASEVKNGQGGTTATPTSSNAAATAAERSEERGEDRLNQFLDAEQLAKLEAEVPRTERQKVPIEQLADWEVSRTDVAPWRLLKMNRGHIWALLLGLLGSLIAGAVAPINTILLGKLMYAVATYQITRDQDALHHEMNVHAPLFAVVAFGAFGGWLLQFFYGYAGELLTTKLRTLLFQRILRQDMSFFDTPGRDAGTLSGMLSGDCEAIHQLCGPAIGIRIQTACTVCVGVIIGLCYQWKLALIATACLPLVIIASLMEQMMMIGANQQKEGDSDDTVVTEALSNVRTVTSFNLRRDRTAAFKRLLKQEQPRTVRRNIIVGVIYGASQFVYYGSFALCYWYGGKLIMKGEANFEKVNVASLSVLMGAISAGEAGGFAAKMGDARKASRRVFSVMDRVPDVDIEDPARDAVVDLTMTAQEGVTGCDITLRHMKFVYPARPNQVVLNSVDLDIYAGSSNGLMGETGCGKSTIIQLLACFYAPRCGQLLINHRFSIDQLSLCAWRRNLSIVLQEPDLFSGTVRENIVYAVLNSEAAAATEEEVVQAAKWACIHDDILAMPEGYNTQVGYKGRALSGGQKQRVAIARGLLRRTTQVLLLDEATSALDNTTEAKVQDGIAAYIEARRRGGNAVTVISVAHRLTTIRNCDQIIVLDGGCILERGTHDELMALNGEYKARWDLYTAGVAVQ